MKLSDFGCCAFSCCATVAILAGCGGGSGTPLSPSTAGLTAERRHARPAYSVLYSFKGYSDDGALPVAALINVNGTLYGTTSNGGANGLGTVFAITSGKETVLHSFGAQGDGALPHASLINVKGTLYGTTFEGGANCSASGGCGTVFKITTSGAETVLHSFGKKRDGGYAGAGLINVKGTLYGTTIGGGATGYGTVFAITTSGKETVLHSFGVGSLDGVFPAGLINVKGTLYGTTYEGGASYGTVFSITTSGTATVLYSFAGGSGDGAFPNAGLLDVKGTLYGTTTYGGTGSCLDGRGSGCGTVFSITTSGTETVLYSFQGGSGDGKDPGAALLNVKGSLYGTTGSGGGDRCAKHQGCGTVFAITTSGAETVLYSFKGGSGDGKDPLAGLINVNDMLYGTTRVGGAYGYGTVFSLSP